MFTGNKLEAPDWDVKGLENANAVEGLGALGKKGKIRYMCVGVHREGETPGWTGTLSERAGQRGAMAVGEEGQ